MYTRSRQSQGTYGNARAPQNNTGSTPAYQTTTTYSQQGNYQTTQVTPQNQQGAYKTTNVQNTQQQFKPAQPAQQQQQQQQQQRVQLPQTPQQAKPQPQLTPQLKQTPQTQQLTNTPQQQRLKPILKQSPATPVVTGAPAINTSMIPTPPAAPAVPSAPPTPAVNPVEPKEEEGNENMDVDNQDQPKWKRAKTPGYKVNRKLKRLRMNQRLRRTLQPKNAIMVLNEMKTGVQFTFPETTAAMTTSLFVVHAEIEGKTYVGQGLSKPLARQNAAENALKCLLLEKMTAAAMKARIDAESDGQAAQTGQPGPNDPAQAVKEENGEGTTPPTETNAEEPDEIPWSSLASFALYKLFLEWQNQGTVVPVPRPGVSPGKAKKEVKPAVQKELPAHALTIHPVMLLNQMRPGLTYVEVNRVGNPPNTMFTLAVEIDGVDYAGTAKNKKDAKKSAAKAALNALFNLTYPEEEKMDHTEDIQMC